MATNFICEECGYKFISEYSQKGKKCPYCGRNRVIEDPSANELVEEA